jgi:hypothetical protein
MQPKLHNQACYTRPSKPFIITTFNRRSTYVTLLLFMLSFIVSQRTVAQWAPVTHLAPNRNAGVMLLLSNGTVMCVSDNVGNGVGSAWNVLTPDATGSYAHGTWSSIASMAKTRLYFSSQVLQDGRVYVAGGEYGSGGHFSEVYDPLTNTWGSLKDQGVFISDANSEILPNGKVLVSPVGDRPHTYIWNPADNTTVAGPSNLGNTNESAWVKLPDGSILYIRTLGTVSERYLPATNTWQTDATVPVPLYESFGAETGAAFMLPNGKAFFIGGNSNTAYYTPSGSAAIGAWTAGPNIPNGLTAPDAAAAMMRSGKILCAVSPASSAGDVFKSPTSFYVFDYSAGANGTFTPISAPGGGSTLNIPSYITNMLDLPNGEVLYGQQGSRQYHVYTPGAQISTNKPVVTTVAKNADGTFTLSGQQINGWSEGAGYGDDWQMNTNYPIVRLTSGGNVYYARSFNWSSTGILTGAQTTQFSTPAGLPTGTYELRVIANGIESDPVDFTPSNIDANPAVTSNYHGRDVSCFGVCDASVTANPVDATNPTFVWKNASNVTISTEEAVTGLCPGTYTVTVTDNGGAGSSVTKSVTVNNTPQLTVAPAATSPFNGFNVSCFGGSNGTADANAAGGTTAYSYDWSNNQHTSTATGLSATTYSVKVTDANSCTASGNVTLTQPTQLTATAAATSNYNGYNVRCNGGSDGTAEAYPAGGVGPYTYLWSDGQTTKVATGLSAKTYSVTITDANGCTVTPPSITLTQPLPLTINAGMNKVVYLGYPDSACTSLTYSGAGGGVGPYTIVWSTGSSSQTINVCPTTTTVYTVTITDKNGCSFSDQATVCVIDVRCGNKMDKVTISHMTGNKKDPCNTICIDINGARNHFLNHPDDQLGACGTVKVCSDAAPMMLVANEAVKDVTVASQKESMFVKTFPNPFSFSTKVRFLMTEDDRVQLKVLDISGKEMMSLFNSNVSAFKEYEVMLNGSALSNGVYLLQLNSLKGKSYVSKLVIAK